MTNDIYYDATFEVQWTVPRPKWLTNPLRRIRWWLEWGRAKSVTITIPNARIERMND